MSDSSPESIEILRREPVDGGSRTDVTVDRATKRVLPLHPLLFGAFPVLSLLSHNRQEVRLQSAVLPLLLALALTALVWLGAGMALRDRRKGALAASLFALMFFAYGHAAGWLSAQVRWTSEALNAVLLVSAMLLFAAALVLLRFVRGPMQAPTRIANTVSVCLVLVPVAVLIMAQLSEAKPAPVQPVAAEMSPGSYLPDVYLIISDAHGRADVLRESFGYDSQEFLNELESLGFEVAYRSAANYSLTPLSLASMLNLRYVDELAGRKGKSFEPLAQRIRYSRLRELLTSQGYSTVAFSGFEWYSDLSNSDVYHSLGSADPFHVQSLELTPLPVLIGGTDWYSLWLHNRDPERQALHQIPDVAADSAATFTFLHMKLPHPPFRYGEQGEDVARHYRGMDEKGAGVRTRSEQVTYRRAYRAQAIYTDRLLLDFARAILQHSQRPPLIMIISDHGPRLNTHWDRPDLTDATEALGNLTAVHFPDTAAPLRGPGELYPTITPVNVMRVALNRCLGADLPLLEDRSYLSVDLRNVYQWVEVTDRLHEPSVSAGGSDPLDTAQLDDQARGVDDEAISR